MLQFRDNQGYGDDTLFFNHLSYEKIIILFIYVDDIILSSDDEDQIK